MYRTSGHSPAHLDTPSIGLHDVHYIVNCYMLSYAHCHSAARRLAYAIHDC